MEEAAPPEPGPWRKSPVRECFEALVVALIVTLFLRTFVVQAFQIPSVSMEPSLLVGDRLLVDKLVYSPSLSAWEDALFGKRAVARGDVVVFKAPSDPSRNFVKRVVALPGETVEVRGRRVLVDGRPLEEPYARFGAPELPPDHPDYGLQRERALEDWGPRQVPQEQFFVLGDNRDRSNDSRFWGFLPRERVEGQALLIYWSSGGAAGPGGALASRRERMFRPVR